MSDILEPDEDIESSKMAVLVENNAQTIFDHLEHLEKQQEIYAKRWFWELLQNAKDSVDTSKGEKVSVKVALLEDKLIFSHTGNPFEQDDVLHLIYHGSSKKKLEGKTGRFGTGFMTTHLLSRQVIIAGKLANGKSFNFELSRIAKDPDEQTDNLELSCQRFSSSRRLESYNAGPYFTSFEYPLAPGKVDVAKKGIDQLHYVLPFVLAFNKEIDKIDITANEKIISIQRGVYNEKKEDQFTIAEQEIILDNRRLIVVMATDSDSTTAVLVDSTSSQWKLIELDSNYPKLFFDFPLLGTQEIGCSVVVNSTKFDLRSERDGIYLGAEVQDSITENKRILDKAFKYTSTLSGILSEKNTAQLFNLLKVHPAAKYEWLHPEWIDKQYKALVTSLLQTSLRFSPSKTASLVDIFIPVPISANQEYFYNLIKDFYPDKLPPYEDIAYWIEVTKGFSEIEGQKISDYTFVINESKICERLAALGTLREITTHLSTNTNSITPIGWLNRLYQILSKDQLETLSSNHAIVPNQLDVLLKRNATSPCLDGVKNEELKNVAELLDWKVRGELIHPEIKINDEVFPKLALEKTVENIFSLAGKLGLTELKEEKFRKGLIRFLKWLLDNNRNSDIGRAWVIVEDGKEAGEFTFMKRALFVTTSEKLLSPYPIWQNEFSLYRDLVKRKFVLIDEYSEHLTVEHFKNLSDKDLIHFSPLINRKNASTQELKILVKREEEGYILSKDIENLDYEFSDIPYLTRTEDGILGKTAESVKSCKLLLKFILTQVLDKDPSFDKTFAANAETGSVLLSKSLWLSRLKTTQWVPIKTDEEEKRIYTSERPSVTNITELIRQEQDLLSEVKKRDAALFFSHLGLSVADIIRNTLSDEDVKLAWDMTFSHLLTSGNISPDLAVVMLQDPNLQKTYETIKTRNERIKKNQDIGYLFEKIFKSIFESEEYKNEGFTIDRTAIGSDFGVVYEEDIVDDNGNETLFKIDKILIELKATGKDYAEMTPRQAEEASKDSTNYVLAVLPLNNYELNEENIRANCRFVTNISGPLKEKHEKFLSFNTEKAKILSDQSSVNLVIEDGTIRYRVKNSVWQQAETLDFMGFIKWLKNQELKPVPSLPMS